MTECGRITPCGRGNQCSCEQTSTNQPTNPKEDTKMNILFERYYQLARCADKARIEGRALPHATKKELEQVKELIQRWCRLPSHARPAK